MAQYVTFTLKHQEPEACRQALVDKVTSLEGVQRIGRIAPEALDPEIACLYFAIVSDDEAKEVLISTLQDDDAVDSLARPAKRLLY